MNRDEFLLHVNSILPDSYSVVSAWITWAKELEELDSSNYELPEGSYKTQDVFLQEFAEVFDAVQKEHGTEVAQRLISVSQIPYCLFPWELKQAAIHLAGGGTIEQIPGLAEDGALEDFYETDTPSALPYSLTPNC